MRAPRARRRAPKVLRRGGGRRSRGSAQRPAPPRTKRGPHTLPYLSPGRAAVLQPCSWVPSKPEMRFLFPFFVLFLFLSCFFGLFFFTGAATHHHRALSCRALNASLFPSARREAFHPLRWERAIRRRARCAATRLWATAAWARCALAPRCCLAARAVSRRAAPCATLPSARSSSLSDVQHRKHPGGRGLAGGQHHHRTLMDRLCVLRSRRAPPPPELRAPARPPTRLRLRPSLHAATLATSARWACGTST